MGLIGNGENILQTHFTPMSGHHPAKTNSLAGNVERLFCIKRVDCMEKQKARHLATSGNFSLATNDQGSGRTKFVSI